jgi:putative ABC transport system permease protein
VIVNETFAKRYFPTGPSIGRFIATSATSIGPLGVNLLRLRPPAPQGAAPLHVPPTQCQIVGVIQDIRDVPIGQTTEPAVYFPMRQFVFREVVLTVRATDRASADSAIQRALHQVAPDVPASPNITWGERIARRTAEPRLLMTTLTFFAVLAAVLAALGVYGLFSWSVALRTHELAIRLTLGARPAAIGGLIIRQGAILVFAGLIAGFVMIRVTQSLLASVLFGVAATDPWSTLTAGAILILAMMIACIPPGLRAMRVDPVVGLRTD